MTAFLPDLRERREGITRLIYLTVIAGVAVFLVKLGPEPWRQVASHWGVFLAIIPFSSAAIIVQAGSFRSVAPPPAARALTWLQMTRIWSFASLASLIAPLFAGAAVRTTMLNRAGMGLRDIAAATARQLWMGLEYALVMGGAGGLFVAAPRLRSLSAIMVLAGLTMIAMRRVAAKSERLSKVAGWRWITKLKAPVAPAAHPWFIAQMALMATIYYIAFNSCGVMIAWHEVLLLSSITILAGLLVAIPNGAGIVDSLWVMVAMKGGLGMPASVALAILMRLAALAAALLVSSAAAIAAQLSRR